jgi:hypothetical protein
MTPFVLNLYRVKIRMITKYGGVGGMRTGRGNQGREFTDKQTA